MSIGYPKMLSGRQKKKSMAPKETEKENKNVVEAKGRDCPRQEGWSTYHEMLKLRPRFKIYESNYSGVEG